jgi:hypothetical protein
MTYLEAVNKVLRRLREPEVGSVDETVYSKLIGEFVSDAKSLVENAWSWSGNIQQNLTIGTFLTSEYTLTGINPQFKTLSVINQTGRSIMDNANTQWLDAQLYINNPAVTTPNCYAYTGFDSSDNATVVVYPIPDKAYDLRFNLVNRDADYTADNDVIKVPSAAIVQFAQALAIEERGETGGTTGSSMMGLAKATLSDAIALDAARFPSETIWTDV